MAIFISKWKDFSYSESQWGNKALKMLFFEDFQDGCLVQGHLWYLNGRTSAILSFKGHQDLKTLFEEFLEGWSLHDHRWYQRLMILAFGWFGWCLPSSFCSRGHMVWKMLFEEFQDGCLVHGHYWYVIGWFKLFWISMLTATSHQVSAWDNLWVARCCLKNIKMFFSSEIWMKWFDLFWVSILRYLSL